jgi:hypothetical protein
MLGTRELEHNLISGMLEIDEIFIENIIQAEKLIGNDYKYLQSEFNNLFKIDSLGFNNFTSTCYPLHPITTYILPLISESIAQNERSIFSFIVSKTPNSSTMCISPFFGGYSPSTTVSNRFTKSITAFGSALILIVVLQVFAILFNIYIIILIFSYNINIQ